MDKTHYNWLTKRFIFMVLLGLIFIPSTEAGCWDPIEPIFSVEEFDDVRCKDMSALDISSRPGLIETLTFNSETIEGGGEMMCMICSVLFNPPIQNL